MKKFWTRRPAGPLRALFALSAALSVILLVPSGAAASDGYFNHPCKVDGTPTTQTVDISVVGAKAIIHVKLSNDGQKPGPTPYSWFECDMSNPTTVPVQIRTYDPLDPYNFTVLAEGYFDENGEATFELTGVDCGDLLIKVQANPPVNECTALGCHHWGSPRAYDIVQVKWTGCTPPPPPPPPDEPPAQGQSTPTAKLSLSKRCNLDYMLIRSSASNGTLRTVRIYVNGKRVKTLTKSPFSYKLRMSVATKKKNSVKVVYTFTDGRTSTKKGTFSPCAKLSADGRGSPGFTG